jgi:hypothetical protein
LNFGVLDFGALNIGAVGSVERLNVLLHLKHDRLECVGAKL